MKQIYKALFAMCSFVINMAYYIEHVFAYSTVQSTTGYVYNCCSSTSCTSAQIINLGSSGAYSAYDAVQVNFTGSSGFCSGTGSCYAGNWQNPYWTNCSGISGVCKYTNYLSGGRCYSCGAHLSVSALTTYYHRGSAATCLYCDNGWYLQKYSSGNACLLCPSGSAGYYSATAKTGGGASANTGCYLPSGTSFFDSVGTGTLKSNCYYAS